MTPDTKRLAVLAGWDGKSWLGPFDPFLEISDAFAVAEKIGGGFQLWRTDEGYGCRMGEAGCLARDGHGKTPAEAISRAAIAWLDAQEKR